MTLAIWGSLLPWSRCSLNIEHQGKDDSEGHSRGSEEESEVGWFSQFLLSSRHCKKTYLFSSILQKSMSKKIQLWKHQSRRKKLEEAKKKGSGPLQTKVMAERNKNGKGWEAGWLHLVVGGGKGNKWMTQEERQRSSFHSGGLMRESCSSSHSYRHAR